MNTNRTFRSLIDEMKAVAKGRKKPVVRANKNSYSSAAARAFAMKLAGKKPGQAKPAKSSDLNISSLAGVTRLMSKENQELLQLIAKGGVTSVADLAAKSHRAESNLSRTLKKLETIGLLELVPGEGRAKIPHLIVKSFEVTINVVSGKVVVTGTKREIASGRGARHHREKTVREAFSVSK